MSFGRGAGERQKVVRNASLFHGLLLYLHWEKAETDMEYEILCSAVERRVKRPMCSPKDFEMLEERVEAAVGERVSVSTLMRIWGYREGVTARQSTLDVLARFVGYADYATLVDQYDSSGLVADGHLDVERALHPGDRLRLTWEPGRVCDVEYVGTARFRVVGAVQTHLTVGMEFECRLILAGEPLFVRLLHSDGSTGIYECGRHGGVKFEVVKTE